MGLGLQQTAWGMKHLSLGLRATYILLEKAERLLEEQHDNAGNVRTMLRPWSSSAC
ncbi:MAG: hypothetical protein K0R61_3516 [Microvirga sp.]|jgi:hypothetical protein|nr:hypothetical protein [Microvirga sp.]